MRSLLWTTLLLSMLPGPAALADACDAKAAEIAGQLGLEAGARAADDSIALSARTDEEDAYGAYLLCGPSGMALRYLSPPSPGPKWYDFVSRSGAILTGVRAGAIVLEARNCIENARLRDGGFRSPGSALRITCSMSKRDTRADLSLAAR
jgi:hypothetical protein